MRTQRPVDKSGYVLPIKHHAAQNNVLIGSGPTTSNGIALMRKMNEIISIGLLNTCVQERYR